MGTEDQRHAGIVDYWNTVEMFCPPSIPAVDDRKWVFRYTGDGPLPWDTAHWLAGIEPDPKKTWLHDVYLGCFDMKRVVEVLERRYGRDPESYDRRNDGMSALAAFTLDENGLLKPKSVELSSCAWATGLVAKGGRPDPRRLEDVRDEVSALIAGELGALVDPDPSPDTDWIAAASPEPVTAHDLRATLAKVAAYLGAGTCLRPEEFRIRSRRVHRRNADEVDDGFLNSLIAADLATVAKRVRDGDYGVALRSYLSGEPAARRVDLREHPEVSLQATRPHAVPLGRWPANPEHPLALSQQFAVNRILDPTATEAVFAVNGPPGTGKTTMLRELVAGIVVRRAERLAALESPGQAFAGRGRWKLGNRQLTINHWQADLVGHEIVVASSNNGAVENVTTEIPGLDAIDERWVGAVDYFRELATVVLNADDPERPVDERVPAWALVAGKLGNMRNRTTFANALWFTRSEPRKDGFVEPPRLQELLSTAIGETPEPWSTCVSRYRAAVAAAEASRQARIVVADGLAVLDRLAAEIAAADVAIGQAQTLAAVADTRARELADSRAQMTSRIDKLRQDREVHRQYRPGLVQALFSRRRLRSWEADDDKIVEQMRVCGEEEKRLNEALQTAVTAGDQARHGARVAGRRMADAIAERDHVAQTVADARQCWGSFVPGDTDDPTARERAAPWTDPAWNIERSQVFLAALRLHRDFLAHEPLRMRQNLSAAADILAGNAPRDLNEPTALAAWQSLFFVVPVVSTTFASFGRVFAHLGAEALGWLFVDEAGQATPQNAVGALWRSRRAVVVGDPLQLEPVMTLPFRAQQSLRIDHAVAERWLPGQCSVQTLADHGMPVGTYLPGADKPRWVGAPLRVHRRCAMPMFGVVNRVVYDGMMVDGVAATRACPAMGDGDRLPPDTTWLDVHAAHADGNWVPAEGERLAQVLTHLNHHGQDMTKVLVIGPFVHVADGMRSVTRRYPGLRAGTVHTAQGKEADIVVLVLGGGSPGARSWAAEKPNLMNVAVSRTRHRLYVIGNLSAWAGLPYFGDLARALPVRD